MALNDKFEAPTPTYDVNDQRRFRMEAARYIEDLTRPLRKWIVSLHATPPTPLRTFDANTATATDTAKALAQLIADLKERGTLT